jgi:hypothetical protein
VPSGTVSGGWFGSLASSAADPANEAALTPNGTAAAAAVNSRLPSGGPANSWPMVCTAYWLPLACGSCSARTSCGSTDCDALLNTTSPTPRPNAATASTAMSVQWTRTRTARTAMTLPCRTWARHISAARSCRSTRTPAGSESSSQGRNSAAVTSEIISGFLVIVTASSGSAATRTPSPVVLTALAHHRRQYAGPRGVRCRAVVSAMSVSIGAGRPAYHG